MNLLRWKYVFLVLMLTGVNQLLHAQAPQFDWVQSGGTSRLDLTGGVKVDGLGNIYFLGVFNSGNITLGKSPGSVTLTSFGGKDYFLAKFNPCKVLQWAIRIGGTSDDCGAFNAMGITFDTLNNPYITGAFRGNCNFTSISASTVTKTSSGLNEAFIAKYNPSGNLQWVVAMGSSGEDEGMDIVSDRNGNIYASGFFGSAASFGSTSGSGGTLNPIGGGGDSYVVKYTWNGVFKNATGSGGPMLELASKLELDHNGDIIVGGQSCCSAGIIYFGPYTMNNAGAWGGYVAKLSSSFVWQWVVHIGGAGDDRAGDPLVDDSNNVYIMLGAGAGTSNIISSSGPSWPYTSAGSMDIMFIKISPAGIIKWVQQMGGIGEDYTTVAWDNGKKFYFSGVFSKTFTFGTGPNARTISSNGLHDYFIAEYNRDGSFNWVVTDGGAGDDGGWALTADTMGNVYFAGFFSGQATFGNQTISSTGLEDFFMVRLRHPDLARSYTITASSPDICNNDSVLLKPDTLFPGFSYQWLRNHTVIAGADSPFYYAKSGGQYKLVLGQGSCSGMTDSSNAVSLNMVTLAPLSAGSDTSICKGDSLRLQATGSGNFRWFPGAKVSDSTLANPWTRTDTNTTYILKSFSGNCAMYDTLKMDVIVLPTVNAGTDTSICSGDSIRLLATGNGNFRWSPAAKVSDSTIAGPWTRINSHSTYILRSFSGKCNVYDTVTVSVLIPPALNAGTDTNICKGDSLKLQASGNGNFRWTPQEKVSDSSAADPWTRTDTSTTYILRSFAGKCSAYDTVVVHVQLPPALNAGADTSICNGDSIRLQPTAGSGYFRWYPQTSVSDSSLVNPWTRTKTPTTYFVKFVSGACTVYDTLLLGIRALPLIDAGRTRFVCEGDTVHLQAAGTGSSYAWSPPSGLSDSSVSNPVASPLLPTLYSVITKDAWGCQAADTVTVGYYPRANTNILNKDTSLCNGDKVQLSATGGTFFKWQPPTGLDNPDINNPVASPSATTVYRLVSSLPPGCSSYDSIRITVLPVPSVYPIDTTVCLNALVTLSAQSNEPGVRYEWSTGDTTQSITVKAGQAATFMVRIGKGPCFSNWTTAFVRVNTPASAFTISPTTGTVALEIHTHNKSTGAVYYYWDFGDRKNVNGRAADTSYIYTDTGRFILRLIAEDLLGCKDTSYQSVLVIDSIFLFIPTSFTPNDDGVNDSWEISLNGAKEFIVLIYDRWGEEIFRQDARSGHQVKWDGSYHGEALPTGSYAFIINYLVYGKGRHQESGMIHLIR